MTIYIVVVFNNGTAYPLRTEFDRLLAIESTNTMAHADLAKRCYGVFATRVPGPVSLAYGTEIYAFSV